MAKYLIRFLLSLSILISSGYSSIYANVDTDNAINSYGGTFENVLGTNSTRQHPLSISTTKGHGSDIFTVNNSKIEEEEEDFAGNDHFVDHKYLTALHFTRIFEFLYQNLSGDLHFSKFVPDTQTHRIHLVIQVFRI